jgi:hypothetical protein
MTSDQLLDRLKKLDPDQGDELERLSVAVRNQSRELIRTLIRAWAGSDVKLAQSARAVLAQCEELPLAPLLDARDALGAEGRVWRVRTAVESELQLRDRTARRLDPGYDDRTPVPMPKLPGGMEEPVMPRRICDETYLLLRRMLNPQEKALAYTMNSRAFLALAEKERDREIENARKRGIWSKLVEDIEE